MLGASVPTPEELVAGMRQQASVLGRAATSTLVAGDADPGTSLVELMSAAAGLVAAAEAVSARAAVQLDRVRRAQEAAAGVPAQRRGRGVGAEVGLARQESAYRGRAFLGFARALCTQMPHTLAGLAAGRLTPWRAMLLVKESDCLEGADRRRLDADLCGDPAVLSGLGDRAVGAAARAWASREDPAAVVRRQGRAAQERRVTLRPAPDAMAYLTALLPVAEGVAAYRALTQRAAAARAAGDERSRGQVMADALVARVTGAEEGAPPGVLVDLVMTDTTLFHGGDEPGWLPGYGPVPADVARRIVADAAARAAGEAGGRRGPGAEGDRGAAGAFVRRLYRAPRSGALVGMDARSRAVPPGLADLVRLRDGGSCRMPWCDAPARHVDHVTAVAEGGATRHDNLQALCEAHNYAKQAPGWSAAAQTGPGATHRVVTRTPTGHRYVGDAPALPGGRLARGEPGPGAGDRPAVGLHLRAAPDPEPSPSEAVLAEVLSRWRAA